MFTRGYLEIPGNFRTGKMGPGSVIGSYHDLTAMEIIPKWAKNGCDLRLAVIYAQIVANCMP